MVSKLGVTFESVKMIIVKNRLYQCAKGESFSFERLL